ncbi:sulfurtransferase TusA family protein [Magnetovibrio sp. PR-2]|uniref:sulfurtransferase TusA family protein n=1 Tax=Magnetovibrio sp. PR-2 TaxID=3120356 RepID=UPI002FCE5772
MGLFSKKQKVEEASSTHSVTLSDGITYTVERVVDCIGDSCPRPQLMTKKTVGEISVGQIIEVLVDNPSSMEALPPMCDELDSTHLETIKDARCWKVYIQKD